MPTSDGPELPLRFQRLGDRLWGWTLRGDPVAGTTDPNPRRALGEGLQLLEGMLEDGSAEEGTVRAAVEDARDTLREAGDSEAVEAAVRVAGRFLWKVRTG